MIYLGNFLFLTNQEAADPNERRHGSRKEPALGKGGIGLDDVVAIAFNELPVLVEADVELATGDGDVDTFDINPFIVGEVGIPAYVADARMTLSLKSK